MAQNIQRPSFYEGQRLGAPDLNLAVDHARGQLARHERYLHTWGIAEGLELVARDRETSDGRKYIEVVLTPGVAIDGSGREIVVTEQEVVSEELFISKNVEINKGDAYYPVFLLGRDETGTAQSGMTGACGVQMPTRILEAYELDFDRPGSELERAAGDPAGIASGPGSAWSILLGYVAWDTSIDRFSALKQEHDGFARVYAGVRAGQVVGRDGTLLLRASGGESTEKIGLLLDEKEGTLKFGKMDARGRVIPVFTVDDKGQVKSEVEAGPGIHLVSGISYDGLLLPLPKGVTQQDIDDGRATLHTHLTPRYEGSAPVAGATLTPLECRADGLRVYCRNRWSPGGDLPGLCDYTLTVVVKGAGA